MKIKHTFSLVSLLLLAALSGCNSNSTSEKKEINILIGGLQQAEEKTFFRTFVRLFEAENGIKVNLTYTNNDQIYTLVDQQVKTESGTIDVIMTDVTYMKKHTGQNHMESLYYLNQYTDRTYTTLFDSYTNVLNERFFAPVSFDIYLTLYNKKALPYIPLSVGVETNSREEITKIEQISWQEISAWSQAIKNETGEARFGFPLGRVSSQLIYPLAGMASAMGSHTLPSFNDDGATKAWAYVEELNNAGALRNNESMSSFNQPTELLNSEELWLSFAHMGPLGNAYKANPERYILGPAPIDEVTKKAGSTAGAWGYGVVKDAPNKDSARKWIEFISDPEINYLYCSGLGGVISPISEVIDFVDNSLSNQIMKIGLEMFSSNTNILIVDISKYRVWNDVKLLFNDLYQEVIDATPITTAKLNEYQSLLDALKITN